MSRDREPINKDRSVLASPITTERSRPERCIPKFITTAYPLHWLTNSRFAAGKRLSPRTAYQYSSLNEDLKETRLLTLHEGDFKTELHTSIQTFPLTQDNPPIYEAFCYVWGSTKSPVDIKVGNDSLAVTRNLASALPYLRYMHRPRILRIDAICVNQRDLKEQAH